MPCLESLDVDEPIRERVEDIDLEYFRKLKKNDILFIDSSHVLRMGGDVFTEYLRILPILRGGVIVHIHDIFLPYEYPREWIVAKKRYWTEQYILQALMAFNAGYKIVAAVNCLAKEHSDVLASVCPVYNELRRGHGSFWIRRIRNE